MRFSSQLAEILVQCPFDEKWQYSLHAAQCQALSTYFSSNLERFFGTIPTSRPSSASIASSFSSFYDKTFSKLWSSSWKKTFSKLWSSSWKKDKSSSASMWLGQSSVSAILEELRDSPYAIQELYRVIKEAESFLHTCSNSEFWWKEAITIGVTTEARDVHIDNLMWCIAGLKLALQMSRGVELESRARFTRLGIAQCYAEMEPLSDQSSQWIANQEQDYRDLLLHLHKMSQKYSKMSFVRKKMMNDQKKQKHDTVLFLIQNLARFDPSLQTEQQLDTTSFSNRPTAPPASMHICSHKLSFPSRPHLLGRGTFASVFEASWQGIKVAVKQFKYPDCKVFFEHEAAVLVKLQSPFIIRLFGWSVDTQQNTCNLVLELVKTNLATHVKDLVKSNLATHVKERRHIKKPLLQLPVVVDFMVQISRAMEYLHSKKIMHRDLKPSNILVEPLNSSQVLMQEGYGRVKLCDFGSARLVNLAECCNDMTSQVGTMAYRAPEVWRLRDGISQEERVVYSFEADVYSFGMISSYCLTGEEPFADITSSTRVRKMLGEGARPELPATCPLPLKELIHKCWSGDPSSRPSFASITMTLKHLKLLLMKATTAQQLSDEFILSTPVISYAELSMATQNFTRRVQNVTSHSMYHGILSDRTNVLVHCMQNLINIDKKLWVKIPQMLSLRHSNIARLHAVCIHSSECWLVYDYTPVRGSLDRWLEDDKLQGPLDTAACYRVAIGAACGLQYLHGQHTVCPVNSRNILLDDRFEPQVLTDFLMCEERAENMDHCQRDDVLHFGNLVSKLLSYMSNTGVDLDTIPQDSQASMLKKVESLCQHSRDVKMDEIVEMLESGYGVHHKDSLLFDPPQEYLHKFSGSFMDTELEESKYVTHIEDSSLLDPPLLEGEKVDRRCFSI